MQPVMHVMQQLMRQMLQQLLHQQHPSTVIAALMYHIEM
jgi:hypothetical protein